MMAAGNYVLGGLVAAVTGGGAWGWDGSYNVLFRNALQTSSFFGTGGTITTPVSTVNITSTASLGGIQGLVVPWWYNSSASTTQVNQVVAFFRAGGDLLVSQDDSANAPVGNALGITTNNYIVTGTTTWNALNYFTSGPFGALGASSITAYYSVADFPSSYGGTVGTTDGSGAASTIYWPKHAFCSTCGALIVTGDTDTWATGATFSPLNNDGIFSLDLVAYMIQNSGGSAPGTPAATPVPASLWLALIGLIAAGAYLGYRERQRSSAIR
jgi:hypothetical protein